MIESILLKKAVDMNDRSQSNSLNKKENKLRESFRNFMNKNEKNTDNKTLDKENLKNLKKVINEIKDKSTFEKDDIILDIENLIDFMEKQYDDLEQNWGMNIETSSSMIEFLNSLNQFLHNILDNGIFIKVGEEQKLLLDKIKFIIEGIDDSSIIGKNATAYEKIYALLSNDIQKILEMMSNETNGISNNKDLDVIRNQELGNNIDKKFDSIDNGLTEGNGESNDSFDNDNVDQKIILKDMKKSIEITNEKVFLTAVSDTNKEEQGTIKSGLENTAILNNKLENITNVQKAYTIVSSAVTRIQVEALMQNISARAAVILNDGNSELRMKLSPPELGRMRISFVIEDSLMRGKIIIETPEAKMFFEQNIDNLRASLAHAGIKLGDVDIEFGNEQEFNSENQDQSQKAIRKKQKEEQIIEKKRLSDSLVDFTA